MTVDRNKPEECDSCHFQTDDLKMYHDRIAGLRHPEKADGWLCELCASTLAGNAWRWPEQYGDSGNTMRTVCYVGNVVLAAIRAASLSSRADQKE
jgi:hypothetical protein